MFENVRDEYITYHRIANTFVNKMGVTILRSTSNTEICESQYGGTTPQAWADPEKGGGRGFGHPGKSQDIWVSIGNKQLDPRPPWKKLDPAPEKCWTDLEPWKMKFFFVINHFTSVNIYD